MVLQLVLCIVRNPDIMRACSLTEACETVLYALFYNASSVLQPIWEQNASSQFAKLLLHFTSPATNTSLCVMEVRTWTEKVWPREGIYCARHSACCAHNLAFFVASAKHMCVRTAAVVLLLYSTELTTGFLFACTYLLIITRGHSHRLIGVLGWERTASKPASLTMLAPQFLALTGFESVWRGFEVGQTVS